MEAAFVEIVISSGVEPFQAILFAAFVRDDDDRRALEPRVLLDVLDELQTVHARHVDVADHQVEVGIADRVPAIHAVHGDLDFVAAIRQQLAFGLANCERIIDDQNALLGGDGRVAGRLRSAQLAAVQQVFDRPQEVIDIDDQHRAAIFQQRGGTDVRHLAEPRIERPNHQVLLALEAVHDQAVFAVMVADEHHAQVRAARLSAGLIEDLLSHHEADIATVDRKILAAFQ